MIKKKTGLSIFTLMEYGRSKLKPPNINSRDIKKYLMVQFFFLYLQTTFTKSNFAWNIVFH